MSDELRANYDDFANSGTYNAMDFMIRSMIAKIVNTSFPCVVTAVERAGSGDRAGYVTVKPLLQPRNVQGQGVNVVEIPKLPYFRLQHGKAAIVIDPKVGDVGLAVVAKGDISNVNGETNPKVPASFRSFDLSDSFYIGGFWGQAPEVFVHLEDSGEINIVAPNAVTVKTKSAVVDAKTMTVKAQVFTVDAPQINLNGAISGGGSTGSNADFSGDVKAKGISLTTHTHNGVKSGDSNTGGPQ